VLRSTARPGDILYVSGTLGDAALGLALLRRSLVLQDTVASEYLIDRYHLPQPRVAVGQGLVGVAHAMLDISDGLVADLGHLCDASRVRGVVEAEKLPLSRAARLAVDADQRRLMDVLGGGDDYELLFSAPAAGGSGHRGGRRGDRSPADRHRPYRGGKRRPGPGPRRSTSGGDHGRVPSFLID
jgi:thiamine-monophosphate kinase